MTEMFKDVNKTQTSDIEINKDTGEVRVGTKVFKSVEEALKGKLAADTFIEQLKVENRELTSQAKLAEKVDKTMSTLERFVNTEKQPDDAQVQTTATPVYDEGKFTAAAEQAAQRILDKASLEGKRQANKDKVESALVEACGSQEAASAAYTKYKASGMFDPEIFDAQMLKTPEALVNTITQFAESPKKTVMGLRPQSTSSLAFKTSQPIRDGAADARLMQKNKRAYQDTPFQQQLMKDIAVMKANGTYGAYLAARESTYKH